MENAPQPKKKEPSNPDVFGSLDIDIPEDRAKLEKLMREANERLGGNKKPAN